MALPVRTLAASRDDGVGIGGRGLGRAHLQPAHPVHRLRELLLHLPHLLLLGHALGRHLRELRPRLLQLGLQRSHPLVRPHRLVLGRQRRRLLFELVAPRVEIHDALLQPLDLLRREPQAVLQLLVLAAQLVDLLEQVGLPLGEVLLLLLEVRRPLLRLRYRIIESLCP